MSKQHYYTFNVISVGAISVGKSSLIRKFSDGIFQDSTETTIGVDMRLKNIQLDGVSVKLFLWDTAGQERFRSIAKSYYRTAKGVMLVIDLTDKNWKEGAKDYLDDLQSNSPSEAVKFLIGNKVDLKSERKADPEEIRVFAEQNGMEYYEASAKSGSNLELVFNTMARRLYQVSVKAELISNKSNKIRRSENEVGPKMPYRLCC